jgi:hypothetical protein
MVGPLSQGKQQNVLSLPQKGCSVREILGGGTPLYILHTPAIMTY